MKKFFYVSVIIYYLFLYWYSVNFLSFSIVEARSIEHFFILKYLFTHVNFHSNDFFIRIIPLIFSFFSLILFFKLSEIYIPKSKYYTTFIFMLIPGFIISSVIVNKSIFLIFLTLLFLYTYKKFRFFSYILLVIYAFLDYSFIALYFSLIFYAMYKKDTKFLFFVLFLLAINANFFNYKITGKPKGFLPDVLGTYFLIFSPLVFLYFLYTLYKGFFYKKDILFFVGGFSFLISLLLSFRQRIKIDDFAPFVLPYTINMINIFLKSYKVRLPRFRRNYKILFIVLLGSMIIFDILLFLNSYTPARELSGSFYFIKPLCKKLKQKNINFIKCNNKFLCDCLNFYGIKNGSKYYLIYYKHKTKVSIFHNNRKILEINVSKLNTL